VHFKLLAVLAVVATACAPARPGEPAPVSYDVDRLLDSMPLRDRIAQLVVPWIPGSYTAFDEPAFQRTLAWIDSLHVGGVLVSIGSPLDIAAQLNYLQRRSRLPLLVGSDLEGGTTFRLNGGTPFPSNMGVGAGARELDAYEMGRVTALEGRAAGIHWTFAPVADINSNPDNPIINTRSFGEDPAAVGRLVAAEVRGIQEHGMLATAKHFPGHGDTSTDTHLALPVIAADWPRLDSLELVPFRAAIGADVGSVMSAHIALPGMDPGQPRPGTLSPAILTGVLRDSLGFKGLAVTDALNMGAIINAYGPGEAAVLAFLAGTDILLQPADPRVTIDAMEAAVKAGRISEERLNRSLRRVLDLKRRLGLFARRTVDLDSLPEVVGSTAFRTLARGISERAVVLARDDRGVVEDLRVRRQRITLIAYGDETSPSGGNALAAELRARGDTVATFRLSPTSGPASYDSAAAVVARSPTALFATAVRFSAGRGTLGLPQLLAELIDRTAAERPTVLVSLGSPYVIRQTPQVTSYVLGWAANAIAEAAVARALTGAPITGKLPIRIPPDYPIGAGLERAATDRAAR
jgi:beta-N-acetylhexosaminidase